MQSINQFYDRIDPRMYKNKIHDKCTYSRKTLFFDPVDPVRLISTYIIDKQRLSKFQYTPLSTIYFSVSTNNSIEQLFSCRFVRPSNIELDRHQHAHIHHHHSHSVHGGSGSLGGRESAAGGES